MSDTVVTESNPKAVIVSAKDDILTSRSRWRNNWFFMISATGCAMGIGNVWRFPYLTFKHGGITFIMTYIWALFIVGVPMLILELTLGQKM
jgi:NSS family neurotransmitter:Na+ symporter